jgi:hypothetical protein
MDVSTIVVPVVSAVLGIGTVSAFVAKYVTKVVKYARVATDAIKLLDDAVECLQDGKVDQDEVNRIIDDIKKVKEDFS